MSARRTLRPPGPIATALAIAGAWLLEPAQPAQERVVTPATSERRVVAVVGLARGCGSTVVARALAAELASRDASGAAAVHCSTRAAGIPLATPAAGRLARLLAEVPGADTKAVGRLCLVGGADHALLADTARYVAPLVLDAGATSLGGSPAAIADEVVLVATPAVTPALASVAVDYLARIGHDPIVVLNRAPAAAAITSPQPHAQAPDRMAPPSWSGRSAHALPESRMGAQLALGGREPRGALGRALAELADLCDGQR